MEEKEFLKQQARAFIEEVKKRPLKKKTEKYYYGVVGKSILFVSDSRSKVLFTKRSHVVEAFRISRLLQTFVTQCTIALFAQRYPEIYKQEDSNFFRTEEYWRTRIEVKNLVEKTNPLGLQVFELEQENLTGEESVDNLEDSK